MARALAARWTLDPRGLTSWSCPELASRTTLGKQQAWRGRRATFTYSRVAIIESKSRLGSYSYGFPENPRTAQRRHRGSPRYRQR